MAGRTEGIGTRVLVLPGLIILLSASLLTFDLPQVDLGQVWESDPELMHTRVTKTIASFLIFLLAWSGGGGGPGPGRRPKAAPLIPRHLGRRPLIPAG
jgi:hypothetical protein